MKTLLFILALIVLYAAYLGWKPLKAKALKVWRGIKDKAAWLKEGKDIDEKLGE